MNLQAPTPVRLRFTATVETPIALPAYAGSALRGAFGHSLRALACTTRAPDCDGCALVSTCPYPAVFAPRHIPTHIPTHTENSSIQHKTRDDSPPYAIEPYSCKTQTSHPTQPLPRSLIEGEALVFHMVLWGPAREHLAIILMAWQRALARGLGLRLPAPTHPSAHAKANNGNAQPTSDQADAPPIQRLPLGTATLTALHTTNAEGQTMPLWFADEGTIDNAALNTAQYALPPCPDWMAQGCMIRLISPLRIQQQGNVLAANALTAQALLAAIHRRCQNVGLNTQIPSIHDTAPKLAMTKHLRWRDASRYSATQQQATPLGGLIGNIVFTSDMRPFWPLLHAAQWLHIGKETVFGLGGIELLPNASQLIGTHGSL